MCKRQKGEKGRCVRKGKRESEKERERGGGRMMKGEKNVGPLNGYEAAISLTMREMQPHLSLVFFFF